MWGFLLETVWSVCCCFNNLEIEAWVRHSGQPSQASVPHQQLLGRGAALLLSARLCLSWGPSHPLALPQSCEPFGQAYRIEEKLLCMEFKGLRCLHCKVSEEGLGWVCLISFYLVLEGRTQRCYLSMWFFMPGSYFLYTHSIFNFLNYCLQKCLS